jgi:uncharacterized protein YbaA (DUF1428 family)
MGYVDGYLLPVPKKNLKTYIRMARLGRKMWRKHGALDYQECVGDDLKPKWGTPFPQMMKLKPGETVVFSYIVFKSRAHRDRVNAQVTKEMEKMGEPKEMPFDMKRMVYGGFKILVNA